MEGIVFGVILVVLFAANVPVALTLLAATVGFILTGSDFPLEIVTQRMWGGVQSVVLSAIPMYILAAILMNNMGVTERIFRFACALVGHLRGGLYYVNILASVIFSGMSGSNTADVAGLGRIEIRAMIDAGYDRAYSAAITAASSIIGPIIPPSIILVVYAQLANVSTGKLFLAGVLPGCLMAFCLSLIVFTAVRAKPVLAGNPLPRASLREFLMSARDGFFALLSPAIIVGGMTLGIVTPSEAGVLAVLYSMLLGLIYGSLSLEVVIRSLREAAFFTGAIMFVIAASGAFGWAVNIMEVPETIGTAIQAVTASKWIALILINIGLLMLGALEAGSAALIIVAPVLIYLGRLYGIDPVQLGIIAAVNLTMGSMTPPVALSLFISAQIAEVPMKRAVLAAIPFFLALIASLLIITYVPEFSLLLPNLLMGT
ncbi:TRAP transporter large permease [Nitratireductor indicus]|uniref:TRAP transporter large permease protein n=1 Tax=Nitratireductor indicus C115 TaxID=1231190 RepID=K2P3D0_9HYPH|nr:TRAP transporter large permease [Nitratireductor indicus]EKF44539.1 putative TRAP dicarboxylate transporter [Nitratireductor indicus C115]MDS1137490.1 TRAP transporter large permease [Nitratireductor indicus]SFQ31108.1 TRAP transporter, DctM subunit [Nitratireductor indicus]